MALSLISDIKLAKWFDTCVGAFNITITVHQGSECNRTRSAVVVIEAHLPCTPSIYGAHYRSVKSGCPQIGAMNYRTLEYDRQALEI